ncbi:hypothetical protein ACFY2Q_03860 [Micromonospora sp. NPDC000316]|uniref:hypothetical protein n=1 Tax=Micromonospora sp. NPDC000316 TaxID=3364216 RepID=UPI00367DAF0E
MSEELPIPRQGEPSDGPTVIEWGGDDEPTERRRFGWSLAGFTQDPRLPVLLAGLGAVAGVASLVGEWMVMTLPSSGGIGTSTIDVPAGVSDIGGFGVGYLVGLLGLVCAVALALRGTAAVRPNARLMGLTLSAALLVLLVAATATLNESGQRTYFYAPQDGFRVEYGRGLVMAFVACVLLGAALRLASTAIEGAPPGTPEGDRPDGGVPGRGWRRRRDRASAQEDGLPAPADLTVTSAVPFTHPQPPA